MLYSMTEKTNMTTQINPTYAPGLEGVPAARTRLSRVDGERGELLIAGYPVEDFADRATFEETVFLLTNDRRPTSDELSSFAAALAQERTLPVEVQTLLYAAAARGAPVIDLLRMASAGLSLGRAPGALRDEAIRVIAAYPTIVALAFRARQGLPPVEPQRDLSQAQNFLYMLQGKSPAPAKVRALDTYWNTVADHGLNASTFAARVIASTHSDMVSAVTGALGALKGPLHGGAPGPALDMVFEIGVADRAEEVIRKKLHSGERLMGFGHRLYRVRDPRADVLARAAERLYQQDAELQALYTLARAVEKTALRLLAAHKPDRILQTNVEFYTALVLHGIGLPVELFTPVFACGRVAGWAAHAIEQYAERILRPDAIYTGAVDRRWGD